VFIVYTCMGIIFISWFISLNTQIIIIIIIFGSRYIYAYI
jgi:hypothetical protein